MEVDVVVQSHLDGTTENPGVLGLELMAGLEAADGAFQPTWAQIAQRLANQHTHGEAGGQPPDRRGRNSEPIVILTLHANHLCLPVA